MDRAEALGRHIAGQLLQLGREGVIAWLAERQHGVVCRQQLLVAGLSKDQIDGRRDGGRLILLHRGVYAVGHRKLTLHGRLMAAVLASSPGAVVSHLSAADLLGIRKWRGRIHVTVPRGGRTPKGVIRHQADLGGDERGTCQGIPTTSPARTLLDLAPLLPDHLLERAVATANSLPPTTHAPLDVLLERHPTAPGSKRLRKLTLPSLTRSDFEAQFQAFLDHHGLERPETNVWLPELEIEADCYWRTHRLIVELDTEDTHRDRFATDRLRDRRALAHGLTSIRVTPEHLTADLAADLRAVMLRQCA